jgi:hypothetical protein
MRPGLMVLLVMLVSSAYGQTEKQLFNGRDLSGWDGDPRFWSVQDGAITGQTTKENPTPNNTFLIWREGTLKDFELRLLWKIEGGNSGIQYRSRDHGKWVVGGYQADMDGAHSYTGILYEERGRGIAAMQGKKVTLPATGKPQVTGDISDPKALKAAIRPDWNEYVIICRGNHLVQKINGITTVEVTDENEKQRMLEGILAFQLHQGPPMKVQFKEITLKVLE